MYIFSELKFDKIGHKKMFILSYTCYPKVDWFHLWGIMKIIMSEYTLYTPEFK